MRSSFVPFIKGLTDLSSSLHNMWKLLWVCKVINPFQSTILCKYSSNYTGLMVFSKPHLMQTISQLLIQFQFFLYSLSVNDIWSCFVKNMAIIVTLSIIYLFIYLFFECYQQFWIIVAEPLTINIVILYSTF